MTTSARCGRRAAVVPLLAALATTAVLMSLAACAVATPAEAPARSNTASANERPRPRAVGVPFEGTPGPCNAITDVAGVQVGHCTLIDGEGPRAVRTGVTAVLPRGTANASAVFGGWHALNGNGEMTGTTWLEEGGVLEGPVMLTNTHSVGVVRDAVTRWALAHGKTDPSGEYSWSLPVVAETWDGRLNDINGFHVTTEHAFAALDNARGGPVAEGNVGGGTGMVCHGWKGGIGTSSRRLTASDGGFTVGVLAQCNYGRRDLLRVAGIPVGQQLVDAARREKSRDDGSIIVVIATDAPLLPHQLRRVAQRATLGLARMGSTSGDGSGDLFVAFSVANAEAAYAAARVDVTMLPNGMLDPVFDATVQATEEAIVNALFAARTMTGRNGNTVEELPIDRVLSILREHGRLVAALSVGRSSSVPTARAAASSPYHLPRQPAAFPAPAAQPPSVPSPNPPIGRTASMPRPRRSIRTNRS
ncbi:MAG: P1 family peptidase [Planctomycetota bacterium]